MAFSNHQLRGMALEEVILYLLRRSGYEPLTAPRPDDPTVQAGHSGLELRGRGAWHQIDAVADYRVTPPFANPIRLLIEAKYLGKRVGLPIVRNAAGVHKDLTENWVIDPAARDLPPTKRFHYLFALFSASEFTRPATQYAYAQDIFLVPLAKTAYLQPILTAIGQLQVPRDYGGQLKEIREYLRDQLLGAPSAPPVTDSVKVSIDALVNVAKQLQYGLIAMFGNRFPVFLVANPAVSIAELALRHEPVDVRIHYRDGEWFIADGYNDAPLFSFDLPDELYQLYAKSGRLDLETIANMKLTQMHEFVGYYLRPDGQLQLIQFRLEPQWAQQLRDKFDVP